MDVVINASPLILLSKTNRLCLVNKLFDTVYIPTAVLKEIQTDKKQDAELYLTKITFKPLEVSNRIAVAGFLGRLHLGEVEVIVGAIENSIQTVILDDNTARNKAKQLGLDVVGTLGILLEANRVGLIADMEQEVANLISAGMYLSDKVIQQIFTQG